MTLNTGECCILFFTVIHPHTCLTWRLQSCSCNCWMWYFYAHSLTTKPAWITLFMIMSQLSSHVDTKPLRACRRKWTLPSLFISSQDSNSLHTHSIILNLIIFVHLFFALPFLPPPIHLHCSALYSLHWFQAFKVRHGLHWRKSLWGVT